MNAYKPPTLKEIIVLAMSMSTNPDMFVQRIEDFLADKFQSNMSGDSKIDSHLEKLFENITGRSIK